VESATDGGFTDGQTPGHLVVAHALLEPTLDEDLLAAAELGGPAGRCVGLQAVATVLGVARFPPPLCSHGMSKGLGNLDLGRQLTLTQCHSRKGQMKRIVQSDTIENLMTAEDDAIAIAIIEPQDWIDERACVAAVRFCVIEERGSRGSIHNIL
jgi:hypothetical protein